MAALLQRAYSHRRRHADATAAARAYCYDMLVNQRRYAPSRIPASATKWLALGVGALTRRCLSRKIGPLSFSPLLSQQTTTELDLGKCRGVSSGDYYRTSFRGVAWERPQSGGSGSPRRNRRPVLGCWRNFGRSLFPRNMGFLAASGAGGSDVYVLRLRAWGGWGRPPCRRAAILRDGPRSGPSRTTPPPNRPAPGALIPGTLPTVDRAPPRAARGSSSASPSVRPPHRLWRGGSGSRRKRCPPCPRQPSAGRSRRCRELREGYRLGAARSTRSRSRARP